MAAKESGLAVKEEVADIQSDDTVDENNKKVKIEGNPFWPFENAHAEEVDDEFGLPKPVINSSGEWVLSAEDIESVCTGAAILGSGGGGSPTVGKILIKHYIHGGKLVKVINPFRLNPLEQGKSTYVAYMGSTTLMLEKGVDDRQTAEAFTGMKTMLESSMMDKVNDDAIPSADGLEVKQSEYPGVYEVSGLENVRSLENNTISLDRTITSMICVETGGLNSLAPLILGATKDIPVLDADEAGRAVPKLEMLTPYIYGCKNFSSCLANGKGNVVAISRCDSAQTLETMSRDICVNMGSVCGCAGTPLTFNEVLNTCVIYSISKAWSLGRVVQRAKEDPDPVKTILESVNGKLIFKGKVIEVSVKPEKGLDHGIILIQGLGNSSDKKIKIITLNESLIVHYATDESTLPTKENVIVTTPTIIAVLDPEKGEAIPNEEIKKRTKVVVVALEANPLLLTETALKVVGPRAFDFDFDYVPFNSGDSKHMFK